MKVSPANPYACAVEFEGEIYWEHVSTQEMFLWILIHQGKVRGSAITYGITPTDEHAWICVPTA